MRKQVSQDVMVEAARLHAKKSCKKCNGRGILTFSAVANGNNMAWMKMCVCAEKALQKAGQNV